MAKKRVGIYLGLNSVGAVAVEGKKILAVSKYDLASVEEEARVENLSEEIRWQALINKILREIGSEEKDIYVSLADKDFIFRSLEMPMMNKKNIGPSLVYEIEKYIPFKISELMWDYSYIAYPKEKKLNISFVGIKENNIYKVQEMFAHLNLNPLVIEPSSLSLIKTLQTAKKFSQTKNFAILDISPSEVYLTFFYQNLPVFNQYLAIPKKGDSFDIDKFVESVRFAFQYFKREFRYYELEKFIAISSSNEGSMASALQEELQINIDTISPYDVVSMPNIESETLKAYGAANVESPYKFRPLLKKTEEYVEEPLVSGDEPLRWWLFAALAGVGLAVMVAISVFFGNEISVLEYKLEQADKAIERPVSLKGLAWSNIEEMLQKKEDRLARLKNLSNVSPVSLSLDRLATLRPNGLWFESVDLDYRDKNYSLSLVGYVFLGNASDESASIDEFVSNIKNDDIMKANFSNVGIVSLERRSLGEYSVTYFLLRLN
ncbi:MAG: pilus assembly protein PilM [Candidatus Omnitrophota bacterium]|jgi:hypothetical protein